MDMKLFQRRTQSGPLLSFRPVRGCGTCGISILDGGYCAACPPPE